MRLIRAVAAVGVLGAWATVAPPAGIGHAAPASSAFCNTVNLPEFDGLYTSGGFDVENGRAGETIIATAAAPTRGAPTATTLYINGAVVASAGFPAVVQYTLPADGRYSPIWAVDGFAEVTWDVSCTPTPACTITGSSGRDVLIGTDGADVICGLGNRDVIDGGGGNDIVLGGAGADTIRGGGGQDQLFGENGADSIDGRDGTPGDVVAGGNGQDTVVGDPGDTVTQ